MGSEAAFAGDGSGGGGLGRVRRGTVVVMNGRVQSVKRVHS